MKHPGPGRDATWSLPRESLLPVLEPPAPVHGDRIERVDGVEPSLRRFSSPTVVPLDVVTFRGVPQDDLETALASESWILEGSSDAWRSRGDGAIVGESLAKRRGIKVGDRFSAAGITVFVAGILRSDHPQDRNVAWVHLPFLQEAARRGGTGSIVTQFNVKVDDPTRLEAIAAQIDEAFAYDEHPTSTRPEKAFVGRAASDIIELVEFAGMLAWGALAAVFALIANAIILSMRDRVRDHAVLQTLGYTGRSSAAWSSSKEHSLVSLVDCWARWPPGQPFSLGTSASPWRD